VSLIPKKVYLRNFGTVKETELTLPKPGLCLVVGHNLTSSSVSSIASGKTLLGEALSRSLLGVSGRFANFGAYSCDLTGNKNMLVQVDCELNGVPLTVWAGYKAKELSATGEGLRFRYGNGEITERGNIRETRQELNQLIGVPTPLASYSVHLDGDKMDFKKMAERDLVDLFSSTRSIANWNEAQKRVSLHINSSKDELATQRAKVSLLNENIDDSEAEIIELTAQSTTVRENLADQRARQKERVDAKTSEISQAQQQLGEYEKSKQKIKQEIKEIEDKKATEYAKISIDLKQTKSEMVVLSIELKTKATVKTEWETKVRAAKSELASLTEPDSCPTCGKPWDKKNTEIANAKKTKIKSLESELKEKVSQHASVEAAYEKLEKRYDELGRQQDNLNVAYQVSSLSKAYESKEKAEKTTRQEISSKSAELENLKKPISDAELISLQVKIETAGKTKVKAQEDIKIVQSSLTEIETFINVLEYLYAAFGPTGITNMMLHDSLDYVNKLSSSLSSSLTGNLIEISFSSSKILADSSERPSLTINVKNRMGSRRLEGSSKGEGCVSDLIVSETLYGLGRLWNKVGYRWLDEAVRSQDSVVRGSVYNFYRSQAKQHNLLTMVVEHSQDVEAYADTIIMAEKSSSGFTTYRVC
jgi:DNA repair exonuclease SbcCD ATPase subunit